jgi:hypothetical protein
MPIYVVGAHNPRVLIPRQALTLSISGSVAAATLTVHASAEQLVMRRNARLSVLPQLSGRVSVVVSPVAGVGAFAPGTVVNLAIGHDSAADLDPVQVVFDPVDVGGDTDVELARLTPVGTGIEVVAAALPDTPLGPLASAARTSARKVVGRGAHGRGGAVVLALDVSASMRPVFADGSAAAATDIVVGVADAIGMQDVTAVLIGENRTEVRSAAGPAGLADAVSGTQPRWCAGARWSRLTDTAARTIVCSDFPTAAVRQRFPVVVFATDPRLGNDCVRMPSPSPGGQAASELLARPAVLDTITSYLARVLQ